MIWFRSANSHTGPQLHRCIRGRTDGSIRLRVTAFLMFSLALKGASTDVAWIGGVGALSPTRVPGYAMRTHRDGVDAPRRHRCAKVVVLNDHHRGGVHGPG